MHAILLAVRQMLEFRRVTTQRRFIPQIDGLRFVAITSVVLFHLYASLEHGAIPVPWVFNTDLAKRGVELFFAISGFILGVPFASRYLVNAPKVDLKQYFLRRLTRLEPPYFISLFVCVAATLVDSNRGINDMVPHLLASLAYIHNLVFGAFSGEINGVAWSLEVEIQFYLLVPLLALLFAIPKARVRRTMIASLIFFAALFSNGLYGSARLHYSIAYYLAFFLAGFLICDLYVTRQEWKQSYLWDALALCSWPLVWYLGRNTGHVLLPFIIVVLFLAAFRGRICSAVFSHRVVTDTGGMCYSIYLFHFLVIYAVKHVTAPLHFGQNFWAYYWLQASLILPFVLVLCGAFYLLVERPCMDREWPRKLWRSGQEFIASAVLARQS